MPKLVLILSLMLLASPAAARMYQWVNPASGRTQMSGTPPAWYRAGDTTTNGGHMPRVLVFENGQLIDDTAIPVNDERRQQLRQQAFRGAELEAHAAAAPPAGTDIKAPATAADTTNEDFGEPVPAAKAKPTTPANPDETIDRMKALIEEWDKQKTEQAKALIDHPPQPGVSAPTTTPAGP